MFELAPGPWAIDRDTYHADRTCVSHSALEVFRESPRLYWKRFVDGGLPEPEPTASMRLGTWVHMAVLEPERWKAHHLVAPPLDRRRKADRELYTQLQDAAAGRELLTEPEAAQVARMAEAVQEDSLVGAWLARPGLSEQAICWQEPATGLRCRALLDRVCGHVVFDLKTTSDPHPGRFARTAATFGYHRQQAWYEDGARLALGMEPTFVFVLVGQEEPYEVAVVEFDQESVRHGRLQNARDMAALAHCRETGEWTWPHGGRVTTIRLPAYAWDLNE